MSPLDKLIAHFERFPGVGLRQARRFAFHILTLPTHDSKDLASLIASLSEAVTECRTCHRFFATDNTTVDRCRLCRDENRDTSKLLIVARDSDIDAVERSRVYDGLYFVLGGTVSLLASPEAKQKVRAGSLKTLVTERLAQGTLAEIILAFAINPDGENTARFIEALLNEIPTSRPFTISYLGRGLSTGSELEYADPETIKNALTHRTGHQ